MEFTPAIMKTPGGRGVSVNVINPKHPVKQAGHAFNVPLVDESGIRFLAECAKERVYNKRDCMILWTGDRGSGKSTGILKTALTIDPEFSIDKVAYYLEDIAKLFASNIQGDGEKGRYPQIISDESGYALYGMQWLSRAQIEIAKNMIINRIKRQIFHAAVPKRKQFNNQIRDMAFMWVHVSEPQEYVQGYAVVRLAPKHMQSEFHSEKYWEPKMAFIFTALEGEFWDTYEAKKIQFVNEASMATASGKALKGDKYKDARDALIRELYNDRKQHGDPITYEALGNIAGIRKSQVAEIVNDSS